MVQFFDMPSNDIPRGIHCLLEECVSKSSAVDVPLYSPPACHARVSLLGERLFSIAVLRVAARPTCNRLRVRSLRRRTWPRWLEERERPGAGSWMYSIRMTIDDGAGCLHHPHTRIP